MKNRKILLVDDEFHIINVLALKLRNAQFEVDTATNGREALDRIRESKPDLLITDYSMPVMTGMELVEELRSSKETEDLPVIILTARGQTVEEEGVESLRISALMSKPFSPREVLSRVQTLLGD